MRTLILTYHKWIVLVISILILSFSLYIDPNEQYVAFRGLRATTAFSLMLLLLFLRREKASLPIIVFMFLHAVSSILTLWFEQDVMATIAMGVNALAFSFLLFCIRAKVEMKGLDRIVSIAMICSALVVGWLSVEFIRILSEYIDYVPLIVSIAVLTLTNFCLAVYAFVYLNEANTGSSILFIFFLILISFAEVFRGIGYFEIVDSELGQYMARILLVGSFNFVYFYGFYVHRRKNLLSSGRKNI